MKQSVYLGEFALAALAGAEERSSEAVLASRLVNAIRLYLGDRDSDRPGWGYPGFLPERSESRETKLDIDVEEGLWRDFAEEAERQGASVSHLASHAALYYAAESSSGRLTRRIVDDLGDDGL